MFVNKMKNVLAGIGVAASAAVCGIMSVGADLSAAEVSPYTEGLGFGATVPAIAFGVTVLVVSLAYVAARRLCKDDEE